MFGPSKSAARIETSKVYAKLLMRHADVPTADFHIFDHSTPAKTFIDDPDVVSRLIVRDAAVRAGGVSPANVFPFHAPTRMAWIGAVSVAASAMLTLMALRHSAIEPAVDVTAEPRIQPGGVSPKAGGSVPEPWRRLEAVG